MRFLSRLSDRIELCSIYPIDSINILSNQSTSIQVQLIISDSGIKGGVIMIGKGVIIFDINNDNENIIDSLMIWDFVEHVNHKCVNP